MILKRRRRLSYAKAALQASRPAMAELIVPVDFASSQSGEYRIQNSSAVGYLLYVGVNSLPDFSQPAHAFSASLPLALSWPLPGSGIQSLYIVPRFRDSYGCISQNSNPWIIRLSPAGEVLNPLPVPESVRTYPRPNTNISVSGQYPTYFMESHPADKVRVWVSTTSPPDVGAVATHEGGILGTPWSVNFGTYGPGTYYVAVAHYRTADGAVSTAVYDTVVFPEIPDSPLAVFTKNITP